MDWGRESMVIHGERQYVLDEVTSWTAMGKFRDLGGQAVLETAQRRTEDWTSGDGTPFTWPATAESFTLTQSERLVVDSDEGIERALAIMSEGVWVQEEEQSFGVSGETPDAGDIDMGGATPPPALARDLTPDRKSVV